MTKYTTIAVALVALLAAFGAIFRYTSLHSEDQAAPLSGNLQLREQYWEGVIEREGPRQAYQDFAKAVSHLVPQKQHENAHVFGGALFVSQGLKGLATCDSNYSFGCFHEFLGRAISSLGLSVVGQLNQDCVTELGSNSLSCQHGIGHGIEAALGYDLSALRRSLSLCKELPYNDPIGGCYGGVFMEYNMQTMLGDQGKSRPLTDTGVQYPCSILPDPYVNACYFWQAQWWHAVLRTSGMSDETAIYAKIGSYCADAPSAYRRSCYEGVGNNVPADADFVGSRARELCIAASADPTYQLYCRSLAADSLFVGGAGGKGDALAVCEGLTGERYQYCAAYASNKANIANELPLVK